MTKRTAFMVAAAFAATLATPTAAHAKILKFKVALDGKYGTEPTGSPATGRATVRVDTVTRRVSVDMDVSGITVDQLWDKLVAAPIGPIHFHKYASPAGGASVLALPLPYGADYRATRRGIRVRMRNYDYDAGAKTVGSTLSFEDFVAGMKSGLIILNVHTDKHNPGEISGLVRLSGRAR